MDEIIEFVPLLGFQRYRPYFDDTPTPAKKQTEKPATELDTTTQQIPESTQILHINLGDGLGDDLDNEPIIFRSVSQRRSDLSNETTKTDESVVFDGISRQRSTSITDDQGRKKRSMSRLFSWHRHRREKTSS
ncbi:hypothetical protein N7481_012116 [Penicillium waksmanii]|uniref:uncharacterized protein n=1 Tax=Penicillium waksmanii TaxID=69791 RepID=UPI002547E2B0|nr:uncharacterized protein N7481_012116 [Penicillium waksmanii]KAJ5965402.1 hypothetical protein N7481_012116 [Penicillium waksmanii]